MKKKILLIASLVITTQLHAQYVDGNNTAPVKLSDVVEAHRQGKESADEKDKSVKEEKGEEGRDYHFSRWLWYWKSHTDENGCMVSPLKTFTEWQKYNSNKGQLKTTAPNLSNWAPEGPYSSTGGYHGVGRINNIKFHPTNANTYWVCTAGGGVWKTINNGVSWTCLTEKLPVLGSSDLGVNPLNPNTLYLCPGDRDGTDTYSLGILKSTDGGLTWNATGLTWTTSQMRLTNAIVVNAVDTNSLTVATSNGIYKSYNGGASWTNVQAGDFKQVLQHPTDTAILYASNYVNSNAAIYRSANGGATWTTVTMTPSSTNRRRITLAVTPGNVAIVKAIVAANSGGLQGFYNSTDTGKTFTRIYAPSGCNGDLITNKNQAPFDACGNQGWYDLAIAIDPNNVNKVIVGGVNSWISSNGGTSWGICTQWWGQAPGVAEVHADKHWQAFHPLVPNLLFECNDGGIYKTSNPGPTSLWTDITSGMNITQFYRNAVADTADYVLGGSQDNGTKALQAASWSDPSGGDGMNCEIDPKDPGTYYTAYQNGDINRFSNVWGNATISDNIPGNPAGAWITPYKIRPQNHDELFAGYRNIYFSPDAGDSWTSIMTNPLTSGNLERLALAPSNDSTVYAVADGSKRVLYTHQYYQTAVKFDTLICPNAGSSISDIKVDPKDHKHFWITMGGYGSDQVIEYRFSTGTWTKMNTNLPNMPVHCIDIDSSNNIMYVGTDVGVFYLDTINKQWEPYNTNLPSIEVADIGINYKTKEIWAATYGRGMWRSPRQQYPSAVDTTDTTNVVTIIPYVADDITISPNPNDGQFTVKAMATGLYGKMVDVSIVDNTGKLVWEAKKVFDGNGIINIRTEGVAAGMYIFLVADDTKVISRKRVMIR